MLSEGVIDENVRYTPVLEGLSRPGYFQWYFDPITHFPVSFESCYQHTVCVLCGGITCVRRMRYFLREL